ncbi:hypothetical protein BVX95_01465 [archaeon D22]|nr:hypothetical protein BVX95_01465 [archaeon D22]
MKLPKQIKRLCKKCKTHTEHKISQAKRRTPGAAHPLARASKTRQKARHRGVGIGTGNRGRYSRPAIAKFKMTGAKTTKKIDLRYECTACKKTSVQSSGIRAKKVELI